MDRRGGRAQLVILYLSLPMSGWDQENSYILFLLVSEINVLKKIPGINSTLFFIDKKQYL